jgi:hypothetical protein
MRLPRRTTVGGLILLGVLIRLLFMPFSLHVDSRFTGDIATFPWAVRVWNSAERTNYTFLYPPLTYHTISAYLSIVSPLTQDLSDTPIAGPQARFNWIAFPFVFRNLFILKLWYLLPDLGVAFLLWRMYRCQLIQARMALLIWVFNPLLLYDAYFHGQYDVVPVFFVVLSLLALATKTFPFSSYCRSYSFLTRPGRAGSNCSWLAQFPTFYFSFPR